MCLKVEVSCGMLLLVVGRDEEERKRCAGSRHFDSRLFALSTTCTSTTTSTATFHLRQRVRRFTHSHSSFYFDLESLWPRISTSCMDISPKADLLAIPRPNIRHLPPVTLAGPSLRLLPSATNRMRLGSGSAPAQVPAASTGTLAVSYPNPAASRALAPVPRLGRVPTSPPSLPDITTTHTIRLRHARVVFSPRQVPHRPTNHRTALRLIVQVRSTRWRRQMMETREISLGSLEHTVRHTVCLYTTRLVQ
jgi:hypothetical protein